MKSLCRWLALSEEHALDDRVAADTREGTEPDLFAGCERVFPALSHCRAASQVLAHRAPDRPQNHL